jgi:hypothetical protein
MYTKEQIDQMIDQGIDPVGQMRADRRHALNAWLAGMDAGDSRYPRWDGDDGRCLRIEEAQFWPKTIKAAEQAEFKRLDAIYEIEKKNLGRKAAKMPFNQ